MVRFLFWRRDRLRTCSECGESWRVPYGLRRQRPPSKWTSGVSPTEAAAPQTVLSAEGMRYALDAAAMRRAAHDKEMSLAAQLAVCPACGSLRWIDRRS